MWVSNPIRSEKILFDPSHPVKLPRVLQFVHADFSLQNHADLQVFIAFLCRAGNGNGVAQECDFGIGFVDSGLHMQVDVAVHQHPALHFTEVMLPKADNLCGDDKYAIVRHL